ncbi:benzaldehyde dehydrogenase [Verrucosispora sioxanthis]|uniref:benzaldehyde dehydrogenase n=1 Tax=Verrucosispora sioxanthis TaxID=2499994 RepID=UPI001C10F6EA|nr:benzaldehyde dehydrogenase [Verrucosispora sioxanthis]
MPLLDTDTWHGRIYSDGWVRSAGGTAAVRAPATGEEIGQIGVADADDVGRAGALWEQHAAEVGDWVVRESGSIPPKGDLETGTAAQECYEAATLPSQSLGEIIPSAQPRLSLARRLPVGVVGVISPFNAPLILAIRSVAPALALGNAVVLKPDLRTAVCGGLSIARVFEEAGLPEGLLHVLPGGVATGEALVADPRVRVISFTGSSAAGRKVGAAAARHLKRAHLELGGNSALVVLDDADLDLAVSAGAWGSFLHQGQICMTTGRHLVHESLAERYVTELAAKADHLPVGDPAKEQVALGPIIDETQRDKIHSLVTSSVDAGARLAAGGSYDGLFYRPTVLADVTPDTPAYAQEVFGPVAPVLSFSDLDEAAALAGASEYGLSLGILSRDVMKAMALAERIPSGIVHINDQTVSDEAVAPFGGVGASGTGSRFGGPAANIEAFTETQWLTVQGDITRYPF